MEGGKLDFQTSNKKAIKTRKKIENGIQKEVSIGYLGAAWPRSRGEEMSVADKELFWEIT